MVCLVSSCIFLRWLARSLASKLNVNKNHMIFNIGDLVWLHLRKERFPNLEYHGLLVDVELGRESLYLALDGVSCIFVHLLEEVDSGTRVHVCALL